MIGRFFYELKLNRLRLRGNVNRSEKLKYIITLVLLLSTTVSAQPSSTIQEQIYFARDKVMPALVHVQPVIKNYSTGEMEKEAVVGSGVIFHEDGYVVTNYHVAGKAERIFCILNDKEMVPAKYIGGDPLTDLSVIKLDLSEYDGHISVAEFGDSDSAQVGQFVMALGSPLSLSRSLSYGVISTKDRYISSNARLPSGENTGRYNLWIQTDAAINPGNSGGPLVNLEGEVIGINTRASFFANNIGFAIPVNVVKSVTAEILDHQKVIRSWIGLHCQPLQELEDYFGADSKNGVLVAWVDKDSPAEKSFLKAGDIITELNGQKVSARFVEQLPGFYSLIASQTPGTELTLKVMRNDEEFIIKVITEELGEIQGEDYEAKEWGFTVKAITQQMQVQNQLEDNKGVFVVGVKNNRSARDGGLRRRDVIIKVNDTDIENLGDFIAIYDSKSENKDNVLLTVKRGGGIKYVLLNLEDATEE